VVITQQAKATILIVDDEAGPREALRFVLNSHYNVYAVGNMEVALEVLNKHKIDLVTLDLKLPGRQGLDLLNEIKREREDLEVIIITGYFGQALSEKALEKGAAAYLMKPFNSADLLDIVDRTLKAKRIVTS
jgi:putative two-component system response regulator